MPPMQLELHPQAVADADADACHRAGRNVGHCTAGIGGVTDLTVAGTPRRQDVLWRIAYQPRQPTPDGYVPAVVMREPNNPHDPNAVRVYVNGFTIGYLFRDQAKQWQPVLKEVKRRSQVISTRRLSGRGTSWRRRSSPPTSSGWSTRRLRFRQTPGTGSPRWGACCERPRTSSGSADLHDARSSAAGEEAV